MPCWALITLHGDGEGLNTLRHFTRQFGLPRHDKKRVTGKLFHDPRRLERYEAILT